jgi:hypothetical protein
VVLLASEQLLAGSRPLLATHNLVIGHQALLSGGSTRRCVVQEGRPPTDGFFLLVRSV